MVTLLKVSVDAGEDGSKMSGVHTLKTKFDTNREGSSSNGDHEQTPHPPTTLTSLLIPMVRRRGTFPFVGLKV